MKQIRCETKQYRRIDYFALTFIPWHERIHQAKGIGAMSAEKRVAAYENGIGAMLAEERMAAYENGLGAMSAQERMAAYENGLWAMSAQERMAAYENGLGAMSAEERMVASEKGSSKDKFGISWERKSMSSKDAWECRR
jgi:hypothetical protein